MNRRDILSAVMGLPAMAGMKASALRPNDPEDKPVPAAGATGEPFVIVLQPKRPMVTPAMDALREQMREFIKDSGLNAWSIVLPWGLEMKTMTADGAIHGGEAEEKPAERKPWVGAVVWEWARANDMIYQFGAPTSRRRKFDVRRVDGRWHLVLLTQADSYGAVTEVPVNLTPAGDVCPYDAADAINSHESAVAAEHQKWFVAEMSKLARPVKESP